MTTIVLVRKNNEVVVAGDGQVSMGNTVVKSTASKVRKIEKRDVVAGFAGSTADALTLFERLEGKLEKHAGNLSRAAVELAKDWRTDKYLRRLEALKAGDKSILGNCASIGFGGHDLKTCFVGSLASDRIASFRSPVAGVVPPHWNF